MIYCEITRVRYTVRYALLKMILYYHPHHCMKVCVLCLRSRLYSLHLYCYRWQHRLSALPICCGRSGRVKTNSIQASHVQPSPLLESLTSPFFSLLWKESSHWCNVASAASCRDTYYGECQRIVQLLWFSLFILLINQKHPCMTCSREVKLILITDGIPML
jgi:hypothetical protein